MAKSKRLILEEELLGTLDFMSLVDDKENWKEIKEEIKYGVTCMEEITEIVLRKLQNWLDDDNNVEKDEFDCLQLFELELRTAWLNYTYDYDLKEMKRKQA